MSIPSDIELLALAQKVAKVFKQKEKYLVTAESCTGGWIAKLMTDIAGSSSWFERGFVTYTNESKYPVLQALVEVQPINPLAQCGLPGANQRRQTVLQKHMLNIVYLLVIEMKYGVRRLNIHLRSY